MTQTTKDQCKEMVKPVCSVCGVSNPHNIYAELLACECPRSHEENEIRQTYPNKDQCKRPIKFRVWSGRMFLDGNDAMLGVVNPDATDIELAFSYAPQGADYAIMQFTGIIDKNGKEIYEGDIVRVDEHYDGDHTMKEKIAMIKWEPCSFFASSDGLWSYYELNPHSTVDPRDLRVEVLGNIYENPELLTESK